MAKPRGPFNPEISAAFAPAVWSASIPFRLWPLFGTHANRQFPVVIIDLRTSLMFWSRRLGQLPCGEWGEFCNGLRRYSSAAITTALAQVMVERNDAKEGDAMGEKRDIKETASLFGVRPWC